MESNFRVTLLLKVYILQARLIAVWLVRQVLLCRLAHGPIRLYRAHWHAAGCQHQNPSYQHFPYAYAFERLYSPACYFRLMKILLSILDWLGSHL